MNEDASRSWILEQGTVIDPNIGSVEKRDLFVVDGLCADAPAADARRVDCRDCVIMPGALDLHVHTREPGSVRAETVATAAQAAAAGGFTSFVAMPNTTPTTDTPERVRRVLALGAEANLVDLKVAAAMTRDRAGKQLTDMLALKQAGAIAISDDGSTPEDTDMMREAMRQAAALDLPVMDHAMIGSLAGNGQLRDPAASRLGVPAIPAESEIQAVQRDIVLAAETGCRIHIQHISTEEAVSLVHDAQAQGVSVSAEATPHHLALCTDDVVRDDADFKMNPPLGTPDDRDAVIRRVLDGTITSLATDHAPHNYQVGTPVRSGAFGIIGLVSALPVTYSLLVTRHGMPLIDWVRLWTTGPNRVLGLPGPDLAGGAPGHVTVFRPGIEWTLRPERGPSLSQNTPFAHQRMRGYPLLTLFHGRSTWRANPMIDKAEPPA